MLGFLCCCGVSIVCDCLAYGVQCVFGGVKWILGIVFGCCGVGRSRSTSLVDLAFDDDGDDEGRLLP